MFDTEFEMAAIVFHAVMRGINGKSQAAFAFGNGQGTDFIFYSMCCTSARYFYLNCHILLGRVIEQQLVLCRLAFFDNTHPLQAKNGCPLRLGGIVGVILHGDDEGFTERAAVPIIRGHAQVDA